MRRAITPINRAWGEGGLVIAPQALPWLLTTVVAQALARPLFQQEHQQSVIMRTLVFADHQMQHAIALAVLGIHIEAPVNQQIDTGCVKTIEPSIASKHIGTLRIGPCGQQRRNGLVRIDTAQCMLQWRNAKNWQHAIHLGLPN